ncbi:115_t:CDS:2 [Entrophospora sp. SA101]|nr:115_t:CDS:2 [Entrophospora sp. SA101]
MVLVNGVEDRDIVPMYPWYCGFYGEIKQAGANSTHHMELSRKQLIPIKDGTIINVLNKCTSEKVHFEIELNPEKINTQEKELEKGYNYLLKIWLSDDDGTINEYEKENKRLQDELTKITNMTAKDLWLKDLDLEEEH